MKLFDKIFKRKPKQVDTKNPIDILVRCNNYEYDITALTKKMNKIFIIINVVYFLAILILYFALGEARFYLVASLGTWFGLMFLYLVFKLVIIKKLVDAKRNKSDNNTQSPNKDV